MKWLILSLMTTLLSAGGASTLEGTEWFDSDGQLVMVEGPAAEPAPVPFVAEWRKREIERRERSFTNQPWGGYWSRGWNRGYRGWYGCRSYRYSYRRCGWSIRPSYRRYSGISGCFRSSGRSGSSLIIRF